MVFLASERAAYITGQVLFRWTAAALRLFRDLNELQNKSSESGTRPLTL